MNSIYPAMLATFLIAAGCGEMAYEDFAEEKSYLEGEIRTVCAGQARGSFGPDEYVQECHWFRPVLGDRCLERMDEALATVVDESGTCEAWEGAQNPISQCDLERVTRRRRGVGCFFNGLVSSGRPLRDRGQPVLAPLLADAVPGRMSSERAASRRQRAAIGWFDIARFEHASVATFCRAAIELMTLGAPLALVTRCQTAGQDEARHAEATKAIAATLYGGPLRFGPLPAVALTPRPLVDVAVDALIEGCLGEASAAVAARSAASHARSDIAAVLETIAIEETEHAALAWATVQWAVAQDPALLDVLQTALDEHRRALTDAAPASPDPGDLQEYGLLSAAQTHALELEVLDALVAPVLLAMRYAAPCAGSAEAESSRQPIEPSARSSAPSSNTASTSSNGSGGLSFRTLCSGPSVLSSTPCVRQC